jgi:hypothetical protein
MATKIAHLMESLSKMEEEIVFNQRSSEPSPRQELADDFDPAGPKTSELATTETFHSEDLHKLVNLGPDIPANFSSRLESVLTKNIQAFRVDRCLGRVDVKAGVPLKEGMQPISMPMFQTSPANRKVIDEQMDTWFQQGVIEPSKSPWGAPAFVVYCNGNP